MAPRWGTRRRRSGLSGPVRCNYLPARVALGGLNRLARERRRKRSPLRPLPWGFGIAVALRVADRPSGILPTTEWGLVRRTSRTL
jgi:hypothetical protein